MTRTNLAQQLDALAHTFDERAKALFQALPEERRAELDAENSAHNVWWWAASDVRSLKSRLVPTRRSSRSVAGQLVAYATNGL